MGALGVVLFDLRLSSGGRLVGFGALLVGSALKSIDLGAWKTGSGFLTGVLMMFGTLGLSALLGVILCRILL